MDIENKYLQPSIKNNLNAKYAERKKVAYELLESSRICPFKWKNSLYFCCYCDQRYTDPELLRNHFSNHPVITPDQIKNYQKSLRCHELVKADITDLSCKLCNDDINDFEDLKIHLYKKHGKDFDPKASGVVPFRVSNDSFKCTLCDKQFNDIKTLIEHMNVHFQHFICEQCGVGFITPDRLRVHMFSHETGPFKCEAEGCDKVFRSRNVKYDHYNIVHLKRKRHKCPHCPESFINHYQRSKHMLKEHGVKMKEFKCDFCPRIFTLSGKLGSHVREKHMKMKRYACSVCYFKVYSKYQLKQHMLTHDKDKHMSKFQCNICKKSYARDYTLKEHMRIHDKGKKQHVCTECGKAFVQLGGLKRHNKTIHSNSGDDK